MRESSAQLTPQQVAIYCGVTAQTVDDWLSKGRLVSSDQNGKPVVAAAELIHFMDENHLAIPPDLIDLPQAVPAPAPIPEAAPAPAAVTKPSSPCAMIVDNDASTSHSIEVILKDLGLNAIRVANASEAYASYDEHLPQLITLEIETGSGGCLDLIESIRKNHQADTKVLVVSNQMPSTLIKAKSAGADAIITKPFDNDTIKRTVKILLRLD